MKIVIDVPERYYNLLKSIDDDKCYMDMLMIKHGTPYEERKTGKWRDKSAGDYRCTNCGNIIELGDEIIMSVKRFKYCPNCGAKMEVE